MVTAEQIERAMAGERIRIPLSAGRTALLWAVAGSIYLTDVSNSDTII